LLHLRVVCPAEQAAPVLDVLRAERGATHVVHLPGAAVVPPGDVVEADVAREALENVLARLCEFDVDHTGGITIETVDTSLSDLANAAEEAAPGEGADALVWEELLARTGEESKLNAIFLAFLTISCLLAAVGVVPRSPRSRSGSSVAGPTW
jgi:hypothetical protein